MTATNLIPSSTDVRDELEIFASDVLGMRTLRKGVSRSLPAETVARMIAVDLELPMDVAWTLREDSEARFLRDADPVGDQIETGAHVVLTAKTHLGAPDRRRDGESPRRR